MILLLCQELGLFGQLVKPTRLTALPEQLLAQKVDLLAHLVVLSFGCIQLDHLVLHTVGIRRSLDAVDLVLHRFGCFVPFGVLDVFDGSLFFVDFVGDLFDLVFGYHELAFFLL